MTGSKIKKAIRIFHQRGNGSDATQDMESRYQFVVSIVLAGLFGLYLGWFPAIILWFTVYAAYQAGRDSYERAISRVREKRLEERGVSKKDIEWIESLGEIDEELRLALAMRLANRK